MEGNPVKSANHSSTLLEYHCTKVQLYQSTRPIVPFPLLHAARVALYQSTTVPLYQSTFITPTRFQYYCTVPRYLAQSTFIISLQYRTTFPRNQSPATYPFPQLHCIGLQVPVSLLHSTSLAVPCITVPLYQPCSISSTSTDSFEQHCVVPSAAVQQLRGQRDNLYSYTGFARYFTFSFSQNIELF